MKLTLSESYSILGISSNASCESIRQAYRQKALKVHPDKNKDPNATQQFQKLSAAYKRICDEKNPKNNQNLNNDDDNESDYYEDITFEEMFKMFEMLFHQAKDGKNSKRHRMDMFSLDKELMKMAELLQDSIDLNDYPESESWEPYDWECDESSDSSNDERYEYNIKTDSKMNVPRHNKINDKETPLTNTGIKNDAKLHSNVLVHGKYTGKVAFIGSVHYASGIFYGIHLNDSMGKNNGWIKGVKYFDCPMRHGLMVRKEDFIVMDK